MTVGSRRLAARCRERLATDPTAFTGTADPETQEPQATVDTTEAESTTAQENIEAAAT